jgi:hypothetical protein
MLLNQYLTELDTQMRAAGRGSIAGKGGFNVLERFLLARDRWYRRPIESDSGGEPRITKWDNRPLDYCRRNCSARFA